VTLGGVEVAPAPRGSTAALEAPARAGNPFMGATVGRVANRTAGGRVAGVPRAALARNDGENCLHGGFVGFAARAWRVEWARATRKYAAVALSLASADGDEGFPEALDARAVFSLSGAAARGAGGGAATLSIEYGAALARGARADAVTPVALTSHCYWAIAGARGGVAGLCAGAALAAQLQVSAARAVPLRESDWLPAGAATVAVAEAAGAGGAGERGAPGALDFRAPRAVADAYALLGAGAAGGADAARGINAFLVVDGWREPADRRPLAPAAVDAPSPHAPALAARLRAAAALRDPASGRAMRVSTTAPGLQLYVNFGGGALPRAAAVCLEPGYPPDTANTAFDAGAESAIERSLVRAGEAREELTTHAFEW